MSDLPSPAAVPAGHVVSIVVGQRVYTSPLMSPGEAEGLASKIEHLCNGRDINSGFFSFTEADGRRVRVKPLAVSVIDPGPPRPVRENRTTTVVHNHFDTGTLSVTELVATQ